MERIEWRIHALSKRSVQSAAKNKVCVTLGREFGKREKRQAERLE